MKFYRGKRSAVAALLLVAATGMSLPAHAGANDTILCNGCSNPKVLVMLNQRQNESSWLVQNNDARTLRAYARPGPGRRVQEVQLHPLAQAYWDAALELYDRNGGSFAVVSPFTLHVVGPGLQALNGNPGEIVFDDVDSTIWNVSSEGYYQDGVGRALESQNSLTEAGIAARVSQLVGMAYGRFRALFGMDDPNTVAASVVGMGFYVDVVTVDGGRIRYRWDPYGHTFKAVRGTAYDVHGNMVPVLPSDLVGEGGAQKLFHFPGTAEGLSNATKFYARVHSFGVPVQFYTPPVTIACSSVGSGPSACTKHQ